MNKIQGVTPVAWVDESMRRLPSGDEIYIMGAAVADPAQCEDHRTKLRSVLPRGDSKLHWHAMDNRKKQRATQVVSEIDAAHLVVVGGHLNIRKQERARACCLERLLWELAELGVDSVVLEQRTQSLNKRDQELIANFRGKRSIPTSMRVDMGQPSDEPMLWVPDQVLGAYGDAQVGEHRWLDMYRGEVREVEVEL